MSITRRGDSYGVRVWDRATKGRRWIGSFSTLKEARQAEAEATIRPRRGRPLTVGQWARIWLSDYARPAPATQRTYRYALQRVTDDIGTSMLVDIDRPTARALAKTWPRGTTRIARTLFAEAVRDGICEVNPFTNLRLETPRGRKDIDALAEPQIRDLAQLARRTAGDYGGEMAAIILTLAYTGMRPGELCALRRADVDLSKREVVVRASLDGTGKEKAPKNGRTRIIALPPAAAQAVSDLSERIDSPYVFHSARGHRLSKGSLSYAWRPVAAAWREKSGRDLDLYELRHACATLLLERGLTPSDVATQLGHTDGGRLVQTLYGHPSEDAARDRLRMAFAGEDARPLAGRTHARARSFPQTS